MFNKSNKRQVQQLLNQIELKKKETLGEKIMTPQEEKTLRSARYFPSEEYVLPLQDILKNFSYYKETQKVHLKTKNETVSYENGLTINFANDSSKLKKIINHEGEENIYLYFNESVIKDFNKLKSDDITRNKFITVCAEPNFAAKKNDQGLKHLPSHVNVKCDVVINGKANKKLFSHEIKINGSSDRILAYALKPTKAGPTILVASHFLKDGLHDNQHNGKTLKANLLSPKEFENKSADTLSQHGIFKSTPSAVKEVSLVSQGAPKLTR